MMPHQTRPLNVPDVSGEQYQMFVSARVGCAGVTDNGGVWELQTGTMCYVEAVRYGPVWTCFSLSGVHMAIHMYGFLAVGAWPCLGRAECHATCEPAESG